ncbi:carboxylate-amine ligase [Actinoplanes sp. CA-015351]|uniref:carboxylate-amine ligase n=1 Tax=Actinoplanes sp. CA-015351 TaxID=3239897 RepID=UPI003D98EC79
MTSHPGIAISAARSLDPSRLTVGVEEEFLLLDPDSMANVPAAEAVRKALPAEAWEQSRQEFRHSMIEMVTPVCASLDEVGQQLRQLRRAAAHAADTNGARLVAVGATPIAEPCRTITDNPRFRAILDHYGPIVDDPAVCGCHVHVGVPDRELAVQVCNHLRPWLPMVQALTVNSPFHAGRDTGHASWRAMQLDRWPALGPTPWFASAEHFDRTVEVLVASGVMLDDSLILWHARPSATYPTVEVRVADVCPTVDDTVLLTGLVRALVATAIDDVAGGRAAPPIPDGVLRAAHWNAAHQGIDGTLLDPRRGQARPAWELVDELVATVTAALSRNGDLPLVEARLARLRRNGTGANRQRRQYERTGDLHAVLADLAHQTVYG